MWSTQLQVWMTSWTTHASWQQQLYDGADCWASIQASSPKLVDVHQALPTGPERAKPFRYCMPHEQGGLSADLGTICIGPLTTWPIDDCSLLVGMHGDVTDAVQQKALGFVRPAQACQWIAAAALKPPVLAAVVQQVEARVRGELKKSATLPQAAEAMFNRTGTGVWTDCVVQSLKLPDAGARWDDVLMEPFEPFERHETRVLPMRGFAWDKGMRGMPRSEICDCSLVRHHSMASWNPEPAS